ncbi:hypothetical protein [uncultured Bacteroides sp.]|uniref:hypothetical protein n=1 Tax=uncultured Bacteroides sp. TaxID=162156 RepID=UPI002670B08A|nr:hypothetical protein [uncultured Bacteroides sp.]
MTIDGTDILESDLGIDVQNEILDRYDSGQSADEIKSYLKNGLQNISSSLDLEIYISTACLTLWEIGLLDDYFVKQLKAIVENGADRTWAEIDKTPLGCRHRQEKRFISLGCCFGVGLTDRPNQCALTIAE